MVDLAKVVDKLVMLVDDDKVESLGETLGGAIKNVVQQAVANTETNIDDTKGIALLNGIAKGILSED